MNLETSSLVGLIMQMAWSSTILLTAALLLIVALRRESAATRHMIGTLTCFGLLALPVLALCLPSWTPRTLDFRLPTFTAETPAMPTASRATTRSGQNSEVGDAAVANTAGLREVTSERVYEPVRERARESRGLESSKTLTLDAPRDASSEASVIESPFKALQSNIAPWMPIALATYGIGILLGLLRMTVQHLSARRLVAQSLPCPPKAGLSDWFGDRIARGNVDVRYSSRVAIPVVTGIVRPTIVLPKSASDWPNDRMHSVLRHEVAHVERHDLAVQMLGQLVSVLYWPQPLVHALTAVMRRDREVACDDRVIAGGTPRSQYARHLLDVAVEFQSRRRFDAGTLAMVRPSKVQRRITSILTGAHDEPAGKGKRIALTLAVTISLFGSVSVRPWSSEASETRRDGSQLLAHSVPAAADAATPSPEITPSDHRTDARDATIEAEPPTREQPTTEPEGQETEGTQTENDEAKPAPSENAATPGAETPASSDQNIASEKTMDAGEAEDDWLTFTGVVVDDQGKPVPNAWMLTSYWAAADDPKIPRQQTDDQGRFTYRLPNQTQNRGLFLTWFYAPGRGVRVANLRLAPIEDNRADDLKIPLPAADPQEFQVFSPDGEPLAGAEVVPNWVDVPNGAFMADEPTGLIGSAPDEILPQLSRQTDASGLATLEAIPRALLYRVLVKSDAYGEQTFELNRASETKPVSLRLSEVGSLRGQLVMTNPSRVAGRQVIVTATVRQSQQRTWNVPQAMVIVSLDEQGRFVAPKLAAPAKLQIDFDWDNALDVQPMLNLSRLEVQPGEELELKIPTEPVTTVTGKVLAADTREPIAGARLSFRHSEALTGGNYVTTDEAGQYTVRVPAGSIRQQLFNLGSFETMTRYDYPRLEPFEISEGTMQVEREPILVQPKQVLRGQLQDSEQQPLAGRAVVWHTGNRRHLRGRATTDQEGKFEILMGGWNDPPRFQRRDKGYWAIVTKEAEGTEPPEYAKLTVIDDDPNAMVLRLP